MQKIRKALRCERGEASYISAVVFVFVAVLCIAILIDVVGLLMSKQKLDYCADQLVKQIQLSGGENSDTQALFNALKAEIPLDNMNYEIETINQKPTPAGMRSAIQLGTPFRLTVTGQANLGGMWRIVPIDIEVVARGAGVSEKYWK